MLKKVHPENMYTCINALSTCRHYQKKVIFSLSRDKVIKHKAPSFLSFYKGPNPLPWTVAEIYHYIVICHAAPGVVREVKTHYELTVALKLLNISNAFNNIQ